MVLLGRAVQISRCLTKYNQLQLPSKSRKEILVGCFSCCSLKTWIMLRGDLQECLSENVCKWIWIGTWTVLRNLMQYFVKSRYTIQTESSFSESVNHTTEYLTLGQSRWEFLGSLQLHNSLLTYCLRPCNHVPCFTVELIFDD